MTVPMIALLVLSGAFWILGLVGELGSAAASMFYLTLSMAAAAFGVWRWRPQPQVRRPGLRETGAPPDVA